MTTGTLSRRTNSSASWEAMRPAPTTPTVPTGRARPRSGTPTGRLARRCTRSKAYIPARNCGETMRSASASSSAAKPASRSSVRAASTRSRARGAAGAAPPSRAATCFRAAATAPSHVAASAVWSVRSTTVRPATTSAAQAIDRSRKSAGSNIASAMPSATALGPDSIRFWLRALSTMTVSAAGTPTRRGSRYVPPQPGTRPRKHSGSATAGTPEEMVRYVQCSAISSPPPMTAPLRNAKLGTPSSPKRRNTSWPRRATARACSRVTTWPVPLRSAPTAKMNGLPVRATARTSPESMPGWTVSRASAMPNSPAGPNVVGLVWSWPLSSVSSARLPPSTSGTSWTWVLVTTSSANSVVISSRS